MQKTSTDVGATNWKGKQSRYEYGGVNWSLSTNIEIQKTHVQQDIEGDGLFNNPLYSGVSKTPFQPATQCTYIMAENSTTSKQIVAIAIKTNFVPKGENMMAYVVQQMLNVMQIWTWGTQLGMKEDGPGNVWRRCK